jgi:hypothetical protein
MIKFDVNKKMIPSTVRVGYMKKKFVAMCVCVCVRVKSKRLTYSYFRLVQDHSAL